MELIKARFRSGGAFLAAYQSQFEKGGLFIATRRAFELGTPVVVSIGFPELSGATQVRGIVAWRRLARQRPGPAKTRAGIGVEFLQADRKKRDFMLAVARGEVVDIKQRRHRRIPVDVQVTWRVKEARARVVSMLEDISQRGAFVRTTHFHPLGSTVLLDLRPPGGERTLTLEGRVAWTRHTEGEEGMGIEFRCRDRGGAHLLKELIRRIEETEYGTAPVAVARNI